MKRVFLLLIVFCFVIGGSDLLSDSALQDSNEETWFVPKRLLNVEYYLKTVKGHYDIPVSSSSVCRGIYMGSDVNQNGKYEIILTDYADGGKVHVFEVTGDNTFTEIWTSPDLGSSYSGPVRDVKVGDLDGNGDYEIIISVNGYGDADSDVGGLMIYEYSKATESFDDGYHCIIDEGALSNRWSIEGIDVFDIDQDGKQEVLIANNGKGEFDSVYVISFDGTFDEGATQVTEFAYGKNASVPIGGSAINATHGDLDGDGNYEAIFGIWDNCAVLIIEATGPDTYEFRNYIQMDTWSTDAVALDNLAVADLDEDGRDEVYATLYSSNSASAGALLGLRCTGELADMTQSNSVFQIAGPGEAGGYGIAIGDIDCDGKVSIYTAAYSSGEIVQHEFQGGDITNSANYEASTFATHSSANGSFGLFVSPVDVDGDGYKELGVSYLEGSGIGATIYEYEEFRELFFSEYIEGSGQNKALEIYNPKEEAVDLSQYAILTASNGGKFYDPAPLSGILGPHETYVIIHPDWDLPLLDSAAIVDTAWGAYATYFNGDDARGLAKLVSGTWDDGTWELIDVIGDTTGDPGNGWDVAGVSEATAEHTLIRKPSITCGNANWTASAGTNSEDSEWIVYDQDTYFGLGYHPEPYIEQAANGNLDLTWEFNTAGESGTIGVADSTSSAWGSDVVVYTDDAYTGIAYVPDMYKSDISVAADFYLIGPTSADAPLYQGLVVKTHASDLAYYRFVYRNSSSSNGQLKLQGYDGSWHISQAWNPGVDFDTIRTGWHRLEIRVIGNDFYAFLDGKMLPGCPYHDDSPFLMEGHPGVYVYNSSNGRVIFDNFVAKTAEEPPLAYAGEDQLVTVGDVVTLHGEILNALPGNKAVWRQIGGPAVTLSDSSDLNATFTVTEEGVYTFKLEIIEGPYCGHSDEVVISTKVPDEDITLDFEDDSDLANWSYWDESNQWTSKAWDETGGVDGSGALKFSDAGYGFLMKRPIKATPGSAYKLTIDVKVTGWDDPNYQLYLSVEGLTGNPDSVPKVMLNGLSDFTTVTLCGIAEDDSGYIKIYGSNAHVSSNVWIDNLNWDDNAESYTISGVVTLEDAGDPSDVSIFLKEFANIWKTNPDAAGNYSLEMVPYGEYTLVATKPGYIDFVLPGLALESDTIIDITLVPGDLNLTFEDDSDVDNWGVVNFENLWTSVIWQEHGGVDSTGGLLIKDIGLGLATERKVFATPSTYFKLSIDMKVKGFEDGTPLYVGIHGISNTDVVKDVTPLTSPDTFTTVTLYGIATNSEGYLQIYNTNTPMGKDSIWIDNLIWDIEAEIPTYTLSGTASLSDGAEPSDIVIRFENYEEFFCDTTDASGSYVIENIPAGTYTIIASKFGYKDFVAENYIIEGDSILDLELIRNQPPVAVAPTDIENAKVGYSYILDASGCYDPDGDLINYNWFASSDTVIFEVYHSGNAGFRPERTGSYTFYLYVDDGTDVSDTVSVTVNVTQEADPPEKPFKYAGSFIKKPIDGAQGVVVDPEGKIWGGWYYHNDRLSVYYPDGTEAVFNPILYGKIGDTEYSLGKCYGMAIDADGNVYFGDTDNDAIFKFDYKTGEPLGGVLVGEGSPTFGITSDGYLYVGKVLGTKIDIYDPSFNLVKTVEMEYGAIGREVEVLPDGSKILIGGFSGQVYVLEGDRENGYHQVDNLPGPFSPTGDMCDIGIDKDGYVYITEANYTTTEDPDYLYIYSPDLAKREKYLLTETDRPRGVGFDPSGEFIYVVDFGGATGGHIRRFALPGAHLITPLIFVRENDENGVPVMKDSIITVAGVVSTSGKEFGSSGPGYIQAWNGTAGLAIYSSDFVNSAKEGDIALVTGELEFFNGLTELKNVTKIEVVDSTDFYDTLLVTGDALQDTAGEELEGVLVRIDNVSIINIEDWPTSELASGGINLMATDGVDTFTIRIDADTDIDGHFPPQQPFSIVGVVCQFDGESPYYSGYQLMPRYVEDFCGKLIEGIESDLGLPKKFALHQNYPNPFNPTTTIKYDLPKGSHVKIVIYDLMGREVRTLVNEFQTPGYKMSIWDGTSNSGEKVPSGLYIYRMITPDFQATKKMTIVK